MRPVFFKFSTIALNAYRSKSVISKNPRNVNSEFLPKNPTAKSEAFANSTEVSIIMHPSESSNKIRNIWGVHLRSNVLADVVSIISFFF